MSAAATRRSPPGTRILERRTLTDSAGKEAAQPDSAWVDENPTTGGENLLKKLHKKAVISKTSVATADGTNLEFEGVAPQVDNTGTPVEGQTSLQYLYDEEYEEESAEDFIHPLNFEVTTTSANPVKFIQDLLSNIRMVDKNATIMPQPNAKAETIELETMDQLPRGAARLENIVNEFIAGLSTTATVMKGKIWIKSSVRFESFKWNGKFKKWLIGSASSPRIQLDRSTLNVVVRVPVGIFLNTVTRFDLAVNFEERLCVMHKEAESNNPLPPFQIEVKLLHRNKVGGARFFRLLAAKENVHKLRKEMLLLFPKPSDETTFIPFDTWNSLPSSKKSEYFEMHRWFSTKHSAIKFRGLWTSEAKVLPSNLPEPGLVSIRKWMCDVQSTKNEPLFLKVFPLVSGVIEIWYNNDVATEADRR